MCYVLQIGHSWTVKVTVGVGETKVEAVVLSSHELQCNVPVLTHCPISSQSSQPATTNIAVHLLQ